jgi:hypothetical protein
MIRALAIIFSLLFFWASAVYGFSGACCCAMEIGSSMYFTDDGVAIQDPSCNCEGPCMDCCCKNRLSFRCVGQFKLLRSSEFELMRPGYQISSLPVALVDVGELLQMFRSIPGQTHSFQLNSSDLFLKTCSFLS